MSKIGFLQSERVSETATGHTGQGFWGRIKGALMASRQRQANREVEYCLARQSNRMLRDIGMSEEDIADLRARHGRQG